MDIPDKSGLVHDTGAEHVTRKSHKSLERDRPKHSGKPMRLGPRKDGFGKGNVGVAGEDYDEEQTLDPHDPDYEDDADSIPPSHDQQATNIAAQPSAVSGSADQQHSK